ncbi:MAG: sulfate ABC transporter permease subunit CysT [Nevskia sp.]|nr:sulfate ABC transporter permease subunit CysT [Nevskia sp.]
MSAATPALATLTQPPRRARPVLPGFDLAMGFTLTYLSLLVLIPLAGLFVRAAGLGAAALLHTLASPRVLAALRLSFGGAVVAAAINAVFGSLVAWTFVRYRFPGKRLFQAMVDLPFALPTAVAGIALTAIYAPNGWLGAPLARLGLKAAYNPAGVVLAMTFIGLPFVVRTLEPVLEEAEKQLEEAAATLGATRWQTVTRIILSAVLPALLTGLALSFARAVGEYGSIIFIAGNLPGASEIAPLLIMIKLEEYDYAGATAVAAAMLVISFALLLAINLLQAWRQRRGA